MELKQAKSNSAGLRFGIPPIDEPDVLVLGGGEKIFLIIKEPRAGWKQMEKKDFNFEPDFAIGCPGGMDAKFLYRQGKELFWRGKMPYGVETAAVNTRRYTLVTDLAGNEIRTEE